ncbi:hypothetical protein QAD02_020756 [Eretmocerus hayati]|uniref:Uncharacterized protein n=1 Tax=Eretmocerus hayati TaxID=131215 RepID=A0ACC2PPC5_9HYME|nr:hypothetical protein QAD02_020756 [Eretmocerus hayati]
MCYVERSKLGEGERYNEDKAKFLGQLGLSQMELEVMETLEKDVELEMDKRYRDIFNQNRMAKLREAKYNPSYKEIRTEETPKYRKEPKKGVQIDIIARLRCGSFEENNKYWLEEKLRACELCKSRGGSLQHLIQDCAKAREWTRDLPGEDSEEKMRFLLSEIGDSKVSKIGKRIEMEKNKIEILEK